MMVRHVEQLLNRVAVDESLPGAYVGRGDLHFRERVFVNQLVLAGDVQERPGERQALGHGCRGQVLRQQPSLELVAVAGRDGPQRLVVAEELLQVAAGLLPDFQRRGLHVGAGEDVGLQELAQGRPLGGFDQSDGR